MEFSEKKKNEIRRTIRICGDVLAEFAIKNISHKAEMELCDLARPTRNAAESLYSLFAKYIAKSKSDISLHIDGVDIHKGVSFIGNTRLDVKSMVVEYKLDDKHKLWNRDTLWIEFYYNNNKIKFLESVLISVTNFYYGRNSTNMSVRY